MLYEEITYAVRGALYEVYNTLGQEVAAVVDGEQDAGWYNVAFDAERLSLASGVYLFRLQAGDFTSIRKMLLIK